MWQIMLLFLFTNIFHISVKFFWWCGSLNTRTLKCLNCHILFYNYWPFFIMFQIFYHTACSHMSPKYFSNPEKFDLDQFKRKGSPPFVYIPFNVAPHICLGNEFAHLEMVVFLHYLVFNYEWLMPMKKLLGLHFPSSKKGFNSNFVKKNLRIN